MRDDGIRQSGLKFSGVARFLDIVRSRLLSTHRPGMDGTEMSDHFYRLTPRNPEHVPSEEDAQKVCMYLRKEIEIYDTSQITYEISSDISFIDCGQSFESVHCNLCGDSIQPWWNGAMDAAYQNKFSDLKIITPCCLKPTSLNDLDYKAGGSAFGKFTITVQNPLSWPEYVVQHAETMLGTKLTLVRQHL